MSSAGLAPTTTSQLGMSNVYFLKCLNHMILIFIKFTLQTNILTKSWKGMSSVGRVPTTPPHRFFIMQTNLLCILWIIKISFSHKVISHWTWEVETFLDISFQTRKMCCILGKMSWIRREGALFLRWCLAAQLARRQTTP